MRGKKAKQIRREIYGDKSRREVHYATDPKTGERFCVGLRSQYQEAKRKAA